MSYLSQPNPPRYSDGPFCHVFFCIDRYGRRTTETFIVRGRAYVNRAGSQIYTVGGIGLQPTWRVQFS